MFYGDVETEDMTYTAECQNPRDWRYRHIASRTRRDDLTEHSNQHQTILLKHGEIHLMCLIKLLQRNRIIKPSLATMSARAPHDES